MPETLEDPEDRKLLTLARATRQRARALEGAALRDTDGRTYAAATVELEALKMSAVGVAVGMAVAAGATGLEAVVVVGERQVESADVAALRSFAGADVPVFRCEPGGSIGETRST